jgi:putative ABC transport system permease protein
MGKVIGLENFQEFMVTGVMKDIPRNSHFQIDLLASITTLSRHSRMLEHWGNIMYHTYVLLEEGASPDGLERKFPEFVKKYIGGAFRSLFEGNPGMLSRYRFHLQPLANIHLRSHLDGEIEPNGDIKYIYIFSAVALFILLIACINFTNITTARSSTRLREVGIRKIVGGWRASLFGHFLGEAFWLVMIALLLGIILVELFLPVFNSFLARELSFSSIPPWKLAGVLLAILALAGLFSGIYPALLLSSIRPVDALKGRMIRGKLSAQGFRTVMVVFQFSISIILIASTLIMFRQMEYIREKKLGFNKDYLLAIDGGRFARLRNRYDAVRAELLNTPGIVAVAASSALPAGPLARTTVRPEGSEFSESVLMANMAVSHEFLDTYGAALAEGRNFSKDLSTDLADAMVINEAAARQFGWKNAVGRKLEIVGNWKGTVIGVARDFHFDSLHAKIEPLILYVRPFFYRYLTVRMHSRDISGTIARIEKIWKNFDNTRPFDFSFLDDKIDQLYRGDRKLSLIFLYFTVLSIGIACLGLFGLVSFAAERRMKEMGIRKVLGASARDIIAHISGQFLKWVLAANILAWPLTYYFMSLWLQNFAYRVGISAAVLLAAAGITLALSIGTVSWQAIRAARSNPADVLRFE